MECETHSNWVPPDNPDLQTILNEAQRDASAGHFPDALAKHVWFHQNALRLQPSLYGVRLSFALAYWKSLADVYPLALVKLREVRDTAEQSIRSHAATGDALRDAFHDCEAIDRMLGESGRTRDLFVWLDEHLPDVARQFYRLAQRALLSLKDYRLCGKFIDANATFEWSLKRYQSKKDLAEDPKTGLNLRVFGEKCFANEIAILVALLVINEHEEDAERIALEALNEFQDADFEAVLEQSMDGIVPDPWP